MGYDQFLTLLCAEMQYQDPLEPTSNTEYVAQLATFSQLEAMLGMQDTQKNEMANNLVGKYVILKVSDETTGKTSYVDGKVDYVMYQEDGSQMLSVNNKLYSIDTLDTVADSDYYEAIGYAKTISNMLAQLPDIENITTKYSGAIEQIRKVYDGMTDYQKSFVSESDLAKLKKYEQKIKDLGGDTSDDTKTDDTKTDTDTKTDDTKTDTDTKTDDTKTDDSKTENGSDQKSDETTGAQERGEKDEPDQQTVFVDRTGNRSVFKTEKRNQSVKDVGCFIRRCLTATATVKVFKACLQRLESRNISLSEEQNARLEDGVEQAHAKGIKDSLVLVDSLAFIVNVPSKTVVTAMDQTETQSNIFTNIDGAVIM